MDRKGKGKQVAETDSSSGGKKRKGGVEFRDEGLRIGKRKNPSVLQFFEESAEVGYYGGSSDEDCDVNDFLNDMDLGGQDDKGTNGNPSFVFPKEEEINEEEYDRIMEERYKPGSGFVRYAEDDVKSSIEMDALVPTAWDPPIWKVKCAIGRERHSVFCLMHKFVELRKLGTKIQIVSVFSVEHVKGFVFIEADKEHDVLQACKNLNGIYATRMMLLPKAEAPHLLTVQRKPKKKTEGTWALVKNGKYKGDLAQVVAVSDARGKALIKLIPRIDMAALTQKYGGGAAIQKGFNPAPRLISSSELEEFRPLIQVRRDRDTGMTFEHLDSLMLKDGFLYKKVSVDSLSSWGVVPTKEEMLKFTPAKQKEPGDMEWISEIYGGEKKKKNLLAGSVAGKGEESEGEKGEGSSGSTSESSYELYNLVCFSRKDFGLIVGVDDKGEGYKVLKEGSDGPAVGKQGVVKQVYRSILFLYAESEEENGGYFCCKSQSCEKIKLFTDESNENEQTGGFDASAFGDSASSPKSPLPPEKEWQPKEKYFNSNQGDRGSMYSIGQKLRIRVGPWKGYLCRVIALRYSDVTVKLDSQPKILTVKSEHLAEVRDRNMQSKSDNAGFEHKPLEESSNGDWTKGAGTSGEDGNWNIGGASSDLSAWGSKPTSDVSSQQPTVPDDNTSWAKAAAENKPASAGDQSGGWNSWGKTPAPEASTVGGWGDAGASTAEASSWGKHVASTSNVENLGSWGKDGVSSDGNKQQEEDPRWSKESSQKKEEPSWGKKVGSDSGFGKGDGESSWGNKDGNSSASNKGVSWGQQDKGSDSMQGGSAWGNQGGGFGSEEKNNGSSGWNKSGEDSNANKKRVPDWGKQDGGASWGKKDDGGSSWGKKDDGGSSWGKKDDGGSSWGKKEDGGSSWGKKDDGNKDDGGSSWGKKDDGNKDDGGLSWGKKVDGGSSWGKKDDGGSSWGKKDDGGSSWGKKVDGGSWGKKDDGGSSWGKKDDGNKDDGGSSWGKKVDGGSSWGKKDDGGSSWGIKDDGGSSWGKKDDGNKDDGGSSWGKKVDGGSSWAKKDDGGSGWGKKDDGGSSWGKKVDGGSSWGKKDDGGSSWGKKDDGGSSWGRNGDGGYSEQSFDRGGRGFGGRRGGGRRGGRDQFGRGRSFGNSEDPAPWSGSSYGGSSWGKQDGGGGGSSWGKQDNGRGGSAWGKQNDGGGGSSWSKQGDGGSKPWEEESGGRGFGGRRGGGGFRGGFRGGRNGGRSYDRDQSSSGWKRDNQESTWKSDQSGGGSDWKKGWGEDSNNPKPADSSSWPSWDTNSKKETNAVAADDDKAAWGTGNGQAKTSGEDDNAWGGKTSAGAPSSTGSSWGTGDKNSGW
ncbi:unnamed protein product [Thlaspi arvense]|uniref:NusG-like N-terminal domain-containing protein n=1 Tax=Thlaspi arvense TaxID=13288 RepID=A0AAU9T1Y4_THLAR|nr:unnamed protein product [Thlaspi arvense]